VRQLLPRPSTVDGDLSLGQLAELYAAPATGPGQTWVRANFVSTLDGAATGSDGRSKSITTRADQQVFTLLRALSDVVVVGAGTATAEAYPRVQLSDELTALRAASGRKDPPTTAVVTRSLDLPDKLLTPRDGAGPLLVICPDDADAGAVVRLRERLGPDSVIAAGAGSVHSGQAVASLADRGLRQVLCEGGPTLMATMVAAGVVDELCLTWSPLVVGGDGPRILDGQSVQTSWRLGHLLDHDDVLIGRWFRAPGAETP
jgi:riboflavin biosynthesis pyrimidine reductase